MNTRSATKFAKMLRSETLRSYALAVIDYRSGKVNEIPDHGSIDPQVACAVCLEIDRALRD